MANTDYERYNPNVVGGSAQGSKTSDELRVETYRKLQSTSNSPDNIGELLSAAVAKVEANFSSKEDKVLAPKYPSDPDVYYVAGGSISVHGDDGRIVFANDNAERTPGSVRLDQRGSTFVSTGATTTLGSDVVKTLSNLLLNPAGATMPSSNITPLKTWIQDILPSFTSTDFVAMSIIKLVQVGLFAGLAALVKSKEQRKDNVIRRDLGTIIIDNADLENKILSNTL